jgi:hypothetical protein
LDWLQRSLSKGEVMLAIPYDCRFVLTGCLARNEVFKGVVPEDNDGWTGHAGIIALMVLNEVTSAAAGKGTSVPTRDSVLQNFMQTWASSFPGPSTWMIILSVGLRRIKGCCNRLRATKFVEKWTTKKKTLPGWLSRSLRRTEIGSRKW